MSKPVLLVDFVFIAYSFACRVSACTISYPPYFGMGVYVRVFQFTLYDLRVRTKQKPSVKFKNAIQKLITKLDI
jgi:hypothetical protein